MLRDSMPRRPSKISLLVGGEKGGTGKSTLSTNLAIMLQRAGRSVLLADCDKQGTSFHFAGRRASQDGLSPLVAAQLSGSQLHIPLGDFTGRYDAVIVDCGGQDSVELRSAMISPLIDRLLIPIQASFFDLETLVNMDALIEQAKAFNPGLQAFCLLNRAPSHSSLTVIGEAQEFIRNELPNIRLIETVLYERIIYNYAAAKGESVFEYERRTKRASKASGELSTLYAELFGELFAVN